MDIFTPSEELKTEIEHSSEDKPVLSVNKPVYHILFAAGGTGGHLFPAVAVAEALQTLTNNQINISFIGTKHRIEASVVPKLGYNFFTMDIKGFTGFNLETMLLPFRVFRSIIKARAIIKVHDIDAVVCTGAYISYPPGIAAHQVKKKLFLMESNINAGKALKMLANYATKIFTSFDKTADFFDEKVKNKMLNLGNPVRKYILENCDPETAKKNYGLDLEKPCLLIMGGSLGAMSINKAVLDNLIYLNESGLEIIWQTGKNFSHSLTLPPNVHEHPFIDNMAEAYAAADFVLCRSGATTISELTITGKPAILVPLPSASNQEQKYNAEFLVEQNAAVLLDNNEVPTKLKETIQHFTLDKEKLKEMGKNAKKVAKPEAAIEIATKILAELAAYDPYKKRV